MPPCKAGCRQLNLISFDGFRICHGSTKICPVADDYSRLLLPDKIAEHRQRALYSGTPSDPQNPANPDTYFQSREATNPWYDAVYTVEKAMDDFAAASGRQYKPLEFRTRRQSA